MIEFEMRIDSRQYLPNGTRIDAASLDPLHTDTPIDDVDRHEAIHGVLLEETGVGVEEMDRIPTGNRLGMTKGRGFSAVAALGPDSVGMRGTGHDVGIAYFAGANIDAARSVARGMIAKKEEHIHEVAAVLHEKGRIWGNDVRRAMKRVDHGGKVVIKLRKPDGSFREVVKEGVKGPTVMVPEEVYDLPLTL